jgi:UDP-N-acetylglucosamine diphosphorylase/glucosamine-1-phosphate N-acetyltransferase
MHLNFFDDSAAANLQPLTLTRPACDLRVGALTIEEKWEFELGMETNWISTSDYLSPVFNKGSLSLLSDQLWINGRLIPDDQIVNALDNAEMNTIIRCGESLLAARLDEKHSEILIRDVGSLLVSDSVKVIEVKDCILVHQLWDFFELNRDEISNDIKRLDLKNIGTVTHTPVYTASSPDDIYIGKDVKIEHGAILIADEGPIIVQDGARIMAGSIVRGPVSIGPKCTVKMGAKIYGNCSFGPHCKVGGEVTDSIFHSYSNKGHDGFVGHSLIGQWVNIGADTNTSNLKNNYSQVKIIDWKSRKNTATGKQFFGSVLGDHCKTAINTMLNTGTVAGVSCNIVSDTFPPKLIPNYAWFSSGNIIKYNFDKATDAMRAMMNRRGIEPDADYIEMMRYLHEQD